LGVNTNEKRPCGVVTSQALVSFDMSSTLACTFPVSSPILAFQSDGNIRQSRNAGFIGAIVWGGPHSLDRNPGELRETPASSKSPNPCAGVTKVYGLFQIN
jgi:hypothetical protein